MDAHVLRDVVQAAITIAGADMANIQLVEGGDLRLAASHGFKPDFLTFFAVVRDAESACGAALEAGVATVVDDVRTSPIFAGKPSLDVMLDAGSLSVVSMPIASRTGRLLGMLSPHRRTVGRPEPSEMVRLEWLARQTAELL